MDLAAELCVDRELKGYSGENRVRSPNQILLICATLDHIAEWLEKQSSGSNASPAELYKRDCEALSKQLKYRSTLDQQNERSEHIERIVEQCATWVEASRNVSKKDIEEFEFGEGVPKLLVEKNASASNETIYTTQKVPANLDTVENRQQIYIRNSTLSSDDLLISLEIHQFFFFFCNRQWCGKRFSVSTRSCRSDTPR